MKLPDFLKLPDKTLPRTYAALLGALGLSSLCQSLLLFSFSYFSWDFGPFCCLAAPWGTAFLIVNFLTYHACRKLYTKRAISQRAARFIAIEAMIANGLPILLGIVSLSLGFLMGARNNLWLGNITGPGLVLGAIAIALIFYPFNGLGLMVSAITLVLIQRQRNWVLSETSM